MKKFFICIIFCCLLLSGCNEKQNIIHEYDNVKVYDSKLQTPFDSETDNILFASNLCVIPKSQKNSEDKKISAGGALLINKTKQQCLFSKNIYDKMYPASITKLITALVALKEDKIEDTVIISKNAANITEPGAKLCGFKQGDKVKMDVLLKSMLVYSGNDAALAIAEHISGSQKAFAKKMNETVRSIGTVNTNFVNPHGLHNNKQYTTPYDLYIIINELLKYEEIYDMFGLKNYKAAYYNSSNKVVGKSFDATNKYLIGQATPPKNIKVVGGKTGTTDKAGNCLALYCVNTKTKDEYISIILNADSSASLYSQMTHLLSYGK